MSYINVIHGGHGAEGTTSIVQSVYLTRRNSIFTNIDPTSINGLIILLFGIELHYSRCQLAAIIHISILTILDLNKIEIVLSTPPNLVML